MNSYFKLFYSFLKSIRRRHFTRTDKNFGAIDKTSTILTPSIIAGRENIYIEEECHIDWNNVIYAVKNKFIMKRHSGAAVGLTVITDNHECNIGEWHNARGNKNLVGKDVIIEEDVWIAANVTLLSGCKIGRGAIIGAGSVVRNTIPPYAIAYGNPCKVVGFKFTPEQIIKHEEALYANDERISKEDIEKNFEEFYGKRSCSNNNQIKNISVKNIINIFKTVFNKTEDEIIQMEYKKDEGWDSIGHMTLIVELENSLGVNILPEDFFKIDSFNHCVEILTKYNIRINEQKSSNISKSYFDFSSFRQNIAIIENGVQYTYEQLDNEIDSIKSSIKQNRLAFLLAENTIGSIVAYTMCVKNSIPVAILDAHKGADVIQNLIKKYRPEYIFLPSELDENYGGIIINKIFNYSIKHLENTNYYIHPDLAVMLTTSGSTGSPKFVRLSIHNMYVNALQIVEYLELDENEKPITALPMYYSFGLSVISSHFTVGATILLTSESVILPSFWEYAKKYGATSISAVPYTYKLFRKMKVLQMDLPQLKTFTQAGGHMVKEDVEYFANECKKLNKRLFVMYGQTEAAPRISYVPHDKIIDRPESIGIPVPGGKMKIADDGELIYIGENVCMGYAQCYEDLAKGDENHGVLNTGDIARIDNEGYAYIIGRKKRFVKAYGNRIGLDDMEKVLSEHFGNIICMGTDDNIIIISDDLSIQGNEVIAFISERTKINQHAFSYHYMKHIPVSDSGKILYNDIKF